MQQKAVYDLRTIQLRFALKLKIIIKCKIAVVLITRSHATKRLI